MGSTDSLLNISEVKELDKKPWIKLREEFVENLDGTSMEEILILTPLPALFLFLSVSLKYCVFSKLNNIIITTKGSKLFSTVTFFLEFLTLVVPIVLQLTVLADFAKAVLVCSLVVSIFVIIFSVSSLNSDILYWRIPHFKGRLLTCDHIGLFSEKQICVTYFRSIVFLMTSISILAVDFHVFPRRFAKTERYGISLMDLGVGLYIMANAIVTKVNVESRKWREIFYESLVLLSLGYLRCALMQRIDYQKHVTEYGTHWNFFISLGLVKLLSSLILKQFKGRSLECGFALLIVHQCLLSFSLEEFVMSGLERENWLIANREGIVSLPGYLSLNLIGISTKNLICPLDRQVAIRSKLAIIAILILSFPILLLTLKFPNDIFEVSRRLANLPYVLWTIIVCFEYLVTGLIFELISLCFLPLCSNYRHNIHSLLIPDVLESINNNSLVFFIISNLLTGLVNLSVDVLNVETSGSLCILLTYTFTICTVVYILNICNVRLKL